MSNEANKIGYKGNQTKKASTMLAFFYYINLGYSLTSAGASAKSSTLRRLA